MPQVRNSLEGEAPNEPHFALLTEGDRETGLWTAIPKGATLLLVEDPTRADKIYPLVLAKVSRKKLVFVCACSELGCTRNYTFVCSVTGWHKAKQRAVASSKSSAQDAIAESARSQETDDPTDP